MQNKIIVYVFMCLGVHSTALLRWHGMKPGAMAVAHIHYIVEVRGWRRKGWNRKGKDGVVWCGVVWCGVV